MTACSGSEQKLVEGGASSGGVAGSSIEKEVKHVEEDIDKCVATLLKDGEAYQQYLKQFETEKLVEKLLKVGDTWELIACSVRTSAVHFVAEMERRPSRG